VNRNLLIILAIAVVLLVATIIFGGLQFTEGEDPAVQMARQTTPSPAPTPPPPPAAEGEEAAEEPPAPAAEEAPPSEEEAAAAESADATPAAEPAEAGETEEAGTGEETGEAPPTEAAAEPGTEPAEAPAAEEESGSASTTSGGGTVQQVESDDGAAPVQESVEEQEAADGEEAEAATTDETTTGEEAETTEEEQDLVTRFKEMDPRDIIKKKYEDLEEKKTKPWDQEFDPDGYIPETGRTDPMTRVSSAVPKELKPPRAGETDENEISTYLWSLQASAIVDYFTFALQCHNVIQIGLDKYATFSLPGFGMFMMEEDFPASLNAGYVEGIPLTLTITCTSIQTDRVVVRIAVTGRGSATTITKDLTYIPNDY